MLQSQCPHCGASNRAGAKFCARCQTPLSDAPTQPCPRCQTTNRVGAKFCVKCGYTLGAPAENAPVAKPAPPAPAKSNTGLLVAGVGVLVLCLVCVVLLAGLLGTGYLSIAMEAPTPTRAPTLVTAARVTPSVTHAPTLAPTSRPTRPVNPPTPTVGAPVSSTDALERAKRGTVSILVPRDSGGSISGSGSVITKRGHILTNNHIIADSTGKLYNAQGRIYIAFPPRDNLKASVEIYYRATLVRNELKNDLALLKISAMRDGSTLPTDLGLAVIPTGDSERVDSGNEVTILGFPGLGGDTLTITRGIISGFLLDDGYIKTDAEINSGNSGGPAFNLAYEQIGIASAAKIRDTSATVPGKIGLIRPINLARALIELAKRDAGE
ncbi:MAG: trypsin-like peptidase domain-containing protein [Chloroflexota bacterium]